MDEIQVVRVLAPVRRHVQVITSSADDINEIQIIRLTGSGTTASGVVPEIQTIECNADAGSFRLLFGGKASDPHLI